MEISGVLSSSIGLIIDLVKDVEKGIALHSNDSVAGDSLDVVSVILQDEAFRLHLAALVLAIKG